MKAKTGNSLTSRLLLGCCVIVLGCGTTSRIGLSEDLKARASEYKVSGRSGIMVKQKLQFGPYTTTHVKRSWVKGPAGSYGYSTGTPGQEDWVNIISADYIRRRQTFDFGMSDGRHQAEAYCVARFNADGLQIGPHKNSILNRGLDVWSWINNQSLYYVQIFTGKEEKPWELVLDNRKAQGNARTYTGVLAKNETEFYTIKPVNRLEQNGKVGTMPFGSVGFEISNAGGKTLAAVSLMEKGMVFLGDATEEEKLLLATLCTALLLQEQIG